MNETVLDEEERGTRRKEGRGGRKGEEEGRGGRSVEEEGATRRRYVLAQKCPAIVGSFPVRDPGANRASQELQP